MDITKVSVITGKVNSMDIPITEDEYKGWIHELKNNGILIQNYFPNLTPEQREFILTGITPEEWQAIIDECEEDNLDDELVYINGDPF